MNNPVSARYVNESLGSAPIPRVIRGSSAKEPRKKQNPESRIQASATAKSRESVPKQGEVEKNERQLLREYLDSGKCFSQRVTHACARRAKASLPRTSSPARSIHSARLRRSLISCAPSRRTSQAPRTRCCTRSHRGAAVRCPRSVAASPSGSD